MYYKITERCNISILSVQWVTDQSNRRVSLTKSTMQVVWHLTSFDISRGIQAAVNRADITTDVIQNVLKMIQMQLINCTT